MLNAVFISAMVPFAPLSPSTVSNLGVTDWKPLEMVLND